MVSMLEHIIVLNKMTDMQFISEGYQISELAEKMKTLSENPKIRIDMGKAARKKLEAEYSLSNHCDELLDIYNELLA